MTGQQYLHIQDFGAKLFLLKRLKQAHLETTEPKYREHVTNYIYLRPEKFKVNLHDAPAGLFDRDDIRLTVDTPEDFAMMQEIYSRLMEEGISLKPEKIVSWIDQHPEYLKRMKGQIEKNKK